MFAAILIAGFVYWYKCKNGDTKIKQLLGQIDEQETTSIQPLLEENENKTTYVY